MDKIINRFLEIFYDISQIPRASRKEEKFASFLEMFARRHNLECYRDINNNVLIKKNGNKTNNEPTILQAHMDMVCVKEKDSNHNFEIDPIEVVKKGDVISAKDTSLGADQGIGLAIMLVILESNKIKHPDLECLFTTEEETTFEGAIKFDYSKLKGKKLINLDHCKDDSIVIGCDADICNKYTLKGNIICSNIPAYKLKINNIKGGNSGVEIERSNNNAIKIMAKVIQELQKGDDILISKIDGGTTENDIATSCECIIKTSDKNLENKIKTITNSEKIEIEKTQNDFAFSIEDSKKIVHEIINLKQGTVTFEKDDIITSGNIGIINTINNEIVIMGILRSIRNEELQKYNNENVLLSKSNNFIVEEVYQDSAWIPNMNAKLKENYKESYFQINKEYPKFEITHGGLECSIFKKRIKDLDMISIGSIIEKFHTTNERMYISSCEKTIKTLLKYLES